MRNILPLPFLVTTLLVGCHSPSADPAHSHTPVVPVAAPPPFRTLLVTTPGTHTSSDGTWRIGVSESSVELSHALPHIEEKGVTSSAWSTVSPQGWQAQAGWFVFVENPSRVWVYDGHRKLLLQTESSNGNHSVGSTYSSKFPCAVPADVLARIPESERAAMKLQLPE